MAKVISLIVSALCVLALAGFTHCHDDLFYVQGNVYCDTCRIQFQTRISENIEGAKVKLECRERELGEVTYTIEGLTDENGQYNLAVEGDHETDICEVRVVHSPREDCNEPMEERARVLCSSNNGILSEIRYANPIGFMINESLSECPEVLDEMGFFPLNK